MTLFFIVTGEASGDRLGAALMLTLKHHCPDAQFIGVSGPLMRSLGCTELFPQEDLAVMGFIDVFKCLPLLLKRRKQVKQAATRLQPAVYIGIDAPDFNLPIERQLKAQGIKTVHVNSPTVWAWRAGRLKSIAKSVDLMLLLFPFEQAIYDQAQIPAKYIGHPLADQLPLIIDTESQKSALGLLKHAPVLALLPGSRVSELTYLAALFIKVARACVHAMPNLQCCVPLINEKSRKIFIAYWQEIAPDLALHCSVGNAHAVMQAADVVLVASGTAALEVMLCHKPMVVAYQMHPVNYWLAKCLIKTPYIALPNILSHALIVPERIQQQASVKQLTRDVLNWFHDASLYTQTQQQFLKLHQDLRQHAAEKAAIAILTLIKP